MGRIIAIDYGLKRCGVATTDPLQIIATPLETVLTDNIISFLENFIKQNEVEKIVIGYPIDLNGNKTDSTLSVEKFKIQMDEKFPLIPNFYEDERFTSKMAKAALVEGGFKKKKRQEKGSLDKISAVFILQSFLKMN